MGRFSLKWLFVGVVLAAIAIHAFLNASEFWHWVARYLLFLSFALSGVCALIRGKRAAFAIGFAVTLFARANTPSFWDVESMEDLFHDEVYAKSLGKDDAARYYTRSRERAYVADAYLILATATLVGCFSQWIARHSDGLTK